MPIALLVVAHPWIQANPQLPDAPRYLDVKIVKKKSKLAEATN